MFEQSQLLWILLEIYSLTPVLLVNCFVVGVQVEISSSVSETATARLVP